jgi:hypothetical protein
MGHGLPLLFFAAMLQPATAVDLSLQDRYDESVGYAYGYSLMPVALGQRCSELNPEFAESIQVGLDKWKERNASALSEISAQWQAYVDRDHKAANLPAELYDKKISGYAAKEVASVFNTLGGESSIHAKVYCQNYGGVTLRGTNLFLEARLFAELDSFRECKQTGRCPNLGKSSK